MFLSYVLIIISIYLFKEAYTRFINPTPINGFIVICVAVTGLVANALGAYLLHRGYEENMNVKAVYPHLFSDALSSLGVVIGGILMQGVPGNIKIKKVVGVIKSIDGVYDIHHVYLWGLDETNINFEAHVNVKDMLVSETKEINEKIEEELNEHFEITHVTIQFECNGCSGVGIIKKN